MRLKVAAMATVARRCTLEREALMGQRTAWPRLKSGSCIGIQAPVAHPLREGVILQLVRPVLELGDQVLGL